MNFYAWTALINMVTSLVTSIFVWSRHEGDPRRITFVLLAMSVAIWSFFYLWWQVATSAPMALFFSRALVMGCLPIPVLFLHYITTITQPFNIGRLRHLLVWGYSLTAVLLVANTTPLVVREVAPRLSFQFWPLPGPLWHVYTMMFTLGVGYGTWVLYQATRRMTSGVRKQLQWLLVGWIVAACGGATNFFLWYGIPIPPIGNTVVPFFVIVTALIAIRYHFMDLRVVVTLTSLLLTVYLIVLGLPFLVGWWGRGWLESRLGPEWWLVPLGLCTALATVGPFAYAYLRRQAEERLLSEQRRYRRTLQLAARGMTQVRDAGRLANLVSRLVSRTVRVTHASLFLWDESAMRYTLRASHGPDQLSTQSRYGLDVSHPLIQWWQQHRRLVTNEDALPAPVVQELTKLEAALLVPGFIKDRLLGFLALGPKRSGAGYAEEDVHAFATLANEAAIAIENALSYEELVKANEQLKAAYDRLVRQERLVLAGQFAAGMAHEIKNPMSAIKTFAQYLPERYQDPAFREKFFRIVQGEIERINILVKDLSDFAKPAPLRLQPTHLATLARDTLALLSDHCLRKGVEVQTAFEENGLTIQADAQQLKQVLLNLCLNSLEAMAQGGRLEVATRLRGGTVTLRVSDTGCGISPEHLQTIWDPFFTTKERGMGLGLAIVKGIVERHGGRISLSSSQRKGTTVDLSLPLSS